MPLDGHSFLVAQGWSGQGTGLRSGAITRPIAIPQKRTLAGLGKDRDEAFPFWDHLFTAAAKAIQVKISADSDSDGASDSEDKSTNPHLPNVKRTKTGLLSNRRPLDGTPASSGVTTPSSTESASALRPTSLMSLAKREAARNALYARLYRGPVLSSEFPEEKIASSSTLTVNGLRMSDEEPMAMTVREMEMDVVVKLTKERKERTKKRESKEERRERNANHSKMEMGDERTIEYIAIEGGTEGTERERKRYEKRERKKRKRDMAGDENGGCKGGREDKIARKEERRKKRREALSETASGTVSEETSAPTHTEFNEEVARKLKQKEEKRKKRQRASDGPPG